MFLSKSNLFNFGFYYMKKSAFTLIELLVVIVIIGILATISVAQFNNYQEKARVAALVAEASSGYTELLARCTAKGTNICTNKKIELNDEDFVSEELGNNDREINRVVAAFDIDYDSAIHTADNFYLFKIGNNSFAYVNSSDNYFCGERRSAIVHKGTSFKFSYADFMDGASNRVVVVAEKVSDNNGSNQKIYKAEIYLNDKKVYQNNECLGAPGMTFDNGAEIDIEIDPTNKLEGYLNIIGVSYK